MTHTVRFGSFAADLAAGELLQHDKRIRLQDKPFQILITLLQQPGEVVTREELRRRLWPADVFVDFDHSLKTAIGKIREALGDSAQRPRFIETLPRRGYRFVAPVEKTADAPPQPHSGRARVAVLPFENLSGDREQEYLSDGMTEEMIAQLGGLHPQQLGVIARTSAMRYKHTHKGIDEIGRELNVDHVVEGSVRRSGDRVRITAQLIKVSDQTHLWAESYERDLRDILALQTQVAQRIAAEIKVKLTPRERAHLTAGGHAAVNRESYEAYLKGRFQLNARSPEGIRRSIEYFQASVERDPAYAPAYAGLADAYRALAVFGLSSPGDVCPKSKAAATRALELDVDLAEAHASLAGVKFRFEWDWAGSERAFQRALELNPSCAEAHRVYALFHQALGRFDEAIAEAQRAREADPLSLLMETAVGWALYFAGRYNEAIRQYETTLEADPNFVPARYNLGRAYAQKRLFREAIAELERAVVLSKRQPHYLAGLGNVYARAGKKGKAGAVISELGRLSKRMLVLPYDMAGVYAGLGKKMEALGWLEKACEERSVRLVLAAVDPTFNGLRSERRFRKILERIGLAGTRR
ncbi:MAG TPA: winged helix-turn-helix domain-containing protein [Terriglobia bacterium]|nr:winged helix-turn-helix domain-containing protein [Terriglobia bacterium]